MRRSVAAGALCLAIVAIANPASAKADFFEFRVRGGDLVHEVKLRVLSPGLSTPADPLLQPAHPWYTISVALGFNGTRELIPVWELTYFPAAPGRAPVVLMRDRSGRESWWLAGAELSAALNAAIDTGRLLPSPAREQAAAAGPDRDGRWPPGAALVLVVMGTTALLARRGAIRGGRRLARAGRA
jgi:hypothetical protein